MTCANNELEELDISNNTELTILICASNNLQSVNARFNFSFKLERFIATDNPQLSCIQVNDVTAANKRSGIYELWNKDNTAAYAENCNVLSIDKVIKNHSMSIYRNPSHGTLHILGNHPSKRSKYLV